MTSTEDVAMPSIDRPFADILDNVPSEDDLLHWLWNLSISDLCKLLSRLREKLVSDPART